MEYENWLDWKKMLVRRRGSEKRKKFSEGMRSAWGSKKWTVKKMLKLWLKRIP